ncbi:MAG TPA: phosphatase PAP2 family protein [Rhizomicrobium sp.]|nr:phosphatase PAP2 family protein [Rhizomicrobium sp.]
MLLWAGFAFLLLGAACFPIDRRASHALYLGLSKPFWRFLSTTTHLAKASHWLIASAIVYAACAIAIRRIGPSPQLSFALQCSEAFILSLCAGSALLHTIKLVSGRRRPRDDIEMRLYGFKPFSFNLQYNSFPSGHALTIMCVAVIASCAWPFLAWLWFGIALWLGLTRAFLSSHYLSDVSVGAGLGLISAREIVIHFFPALSQPWF